MGDEYGSDDPMAMGVDSSGEPVHHWSSDTVGEVGGIHGASIESIDANAHAMGPDGVPLPDVDIPPEVHPPKTGDWAQDKLRKEYDEVTHPDPDAHQPDPITEQADHERHAQDVEAPPAKGAHTLNIPEQHF
jgi:hypothetical protein